MTQSVVILSSAKRATISVPPPSEEVMPGVRWGECSHLFSPAYWVIRVAYARMDRSYESHRLGKCLVEEVAACLLGGYGMPAEIGLLAFRRLSQRGLLSTDATESMIREALCEPMKWRGRNVRYRYPVQKAKYLAEALRRLREESPPLTNHVAFRNWLWSFKGIGPKTASWITRNFLGSDEVAILDVHIQRAGLLAGIFDPRQTVEKHYVELENRLVSFAKAIGVRLSILDALIWAEMRDLGWLATEMLSAKASRSVC